MQTVFTVLAYFGTWLSSADAFARILFFAAYLLVYVLFFRSVFSEQRLVRFLRLLFWVAVGWFVVEIVSVSAAQYALWNADAVTRQLLPPSQPVGYFLRYAWLHFAQATALSAAAGVLFFILFAAGNEISRGRFFYEDEEYGGALAIILNPWPQAILVLPLVLAIGIIMSAFRIARRHTGAAQEKVSLFNLRWLWPLAGIAAFVLGKFIISLLGLGALKA